MEKKRNSIWFFCQYGQQPPFNTMLRYHNWGKILASMGYKVTVFCASTVHNTEINLIEDKSKYKEYFCDGIYYVYIKTRPYDGYGIKRALNILDFYLGLYKVTKVYEFPDVIITSSPSMLTARAGIRIARQKNIPCICDIVDLWPQAIIEVTHMSSHNPLIVFLFQLLRWIIRNSSALIFSMEGGKQYLIDNNWSKDIDMKKVHYINMGVDIPKFDENTQKKTMNDNNLFRNDVFKVVYCGSVRPVNNVKTICDGARIIKQRGYNDILFLIYGNGNQLNELINYCKENKIDNVKFYGRIEKDNIPFLLTHADLNILNYKQLPIFRYGGSQSKLFEYLASGKPILSNARFGYDLLERFKCGLTTPTQSPVDFADGVEYFYTMSNDERREIGKRSRRVAEEFAQPLLVDKLLEIIDSL